MSWFLVELLCFNLVFFMCLIGAVLGLLRTLMGKPKGATLLFVSVAIPLLIGLLFPLFNLHFGGE